VIIRFSEDENTAWLDNGERVRFNTDDYADEPPCYRCWAGPYCKTWDGRPSLCIGPDRKDGRSGNWLYDAEEVVDDNQVQ
jgi:hypothetical protein